MTFIGVIVKYTVTDGMAVTDVFDVLVLHGVESPLLLMPRREISGTRLLLRRDSVLPTPA